jgi:hypothetical protein
MLCYNSLHTTLVYVVVRNFRIGSGPKKLFFVVGGFSSGSLLRLETSARSVFEQGAVDATLFPLMFTKYCSILRLAAGTNYFRARVREHQKISHCYKSMKNG